MWFFSPLSLDLLHAHTVCVSVYVHRLHMCVVVSAYMSGLRVLSRGRRGSRRRCCICLCSHRGPSLRPAARTPHRPRPSAGSHCWRRSRSSGRRPERWRWLLPVTHRGQRHPRLEHRSNTCKCHCHLEEGCGKPKAF